MPRVYLGLALLLIALSLAGSSGTAAGRPGDGAARVEQPWACTFSIAAYDPDKKEWGVAVASKYLAVGSVVPWAKAGVGAVATQASVNATYGPRGLELLAEGKSPEDVVKTLTDADKGKDFRQLGVIDAK